MASMKKCWQFSRRYRTPRRCSMRSSSWWTTTPSLPMCPAASRQRTPKRCTKRTRAKRPSLVLRKFSAITMQPSAHWMSVIMWHCSIGIRAKISAVFRSIRKSSPFLRTHRQRCPTKFLRWYWQTSSSAVN